MRIGTWNLANRKPTDGHIKLLMEAKCDVWLLTEINPRWDGILREQCKLEFHKSDATMGGRQHWAGVAFLESMELEPLPAPHPASVLASGNESCFVLPFCLGEERELVHLGSVRAMLSAFSRHLRRCSRRYHVRNLCGVETGIMRSRDMRLQATSRDAKSFWMPLNGWTWRCRQKIFPLELMALMASHITALTTSRYQDRGPHQVPSTSLPRAYPIMMLMWLK